ncbi:carbohydrate porin [Thalassotalea nanhaiensis]|uniref:Carbohydrate porin n=1 Tax=Thalassotalea nanhaiensis TaxID=3065648 RepID=A0ABY9TFY2_9GAMM|nr:carbohydrate porin [Colwelliaceae bacterium SQ345]
MKHISILFNLIVLALALTLSPGVYAKDASTKEKPYDDDEGYGAPGESSAQLEEDNKDKYPLIRMPILDQATEDLRAWKSQLYKDTGLQFGIAYTSMMQEVVEPDINANTAGSGILRFTGKWELVDRGGKNPGAFVFSLDHRHDYGDTAPASLGGGFGYLSQTAMLFNDSKDIIGDVKWTQALFDGNGGMVIGRYDPNDYHNVLGYASPWTGFSNLDNLINMSIAAPDWSWGVGIGGWLNDSYYVLGGVNDANGVATDDLEFFEEGTDELYKYAEFGWSPTRNDRYFKNFHVTLWQVDERKVKGADSDSYGVVFGFNWTWNMEWMIFSQLGFSDADSANDVQLYEQEVNIGFIKYFEDRSDLFGMAINHGKIIEPLYDVGFAANEYTTTFETFYRFQLAETVQITPNFQYIIDPHTNAEDDSAFVASVRFRITL